MIVNVVSFILSNDRLCNFLSITNIVLVEFSCANLKLFVTNQIVELAPTPFDDVDLAWNYWYMTYNCHHLA
jgi:hypothetical protein